MFEYINHHFNLQAHVVEKDFTVDEKMFTTDILYDFSPVLTLPNSLETFKASHKGKFWYNLRRSKKLFVAGCGDFSFDNYIDNDAISLLEEIRVLFLKKWEKKYTSFSWKSEKGFCKFKSHVKKIIKECPGIFVINTIRLNNNDSTIIAYSIGFIIEETFYFYMHGVNSAYNKSSFSLGTIFLEELITSLILNPRVMVFDFMTGLNPYKLKWTNKTKPIFWRIETNKAFWNYPIHVAKIVIFTIKIKIQKNTFFSDHIKQFFIAINRFNISRGAIRLIEKHILKME